MAPALVARGVSRGYEQVAWRVLPGRRRLLVGFTWVFRAFSILAKSRAAYIPLTPPPSSASMLKPLFGFMMWLTSITPVAIPAAGRTAYHVIPLAIHGSTSRDLDLMIDV